MSSENPNTVDFYNKLYTGIYEIEDVSQPYEYESSSRREWYRNLIGTPFFDCEGLILDVGCGTAGAFSALPLNGILKKYGVDFSPVAIGIAKERVDGIFLIADVHSLPFRKDSFDRVFSTETLEHVSEPEKVIAEMGRVLKSGGELMITVPEKDLDLTIDEWPGRVDLHINKFTIDKVREIINFYQLKERSVEIFEREIWFVASKS